jgi:hypothetical protein
MDNNLPEPQDATIVQPETVLPLPPQPLLRISLKQKIHERWDNRPRVSLSRFKFWGTLSFGIALIIIGLLMTFVFKV